MPETPDDGLHPDAPRQKSPVKWMVLMLLIVIAATIPTLGGKEKNSIKASPTIPELSPLAHPGRTVINARCAVRQRVEGTDGSRTRPPVLHP